MNSHKNNHNDANHSHIDNEKSLESSSTENMIFSSKKDNSNQDEGSGLFARYFALDQMLSRLSDIDFSATPDATETVSELNNMRMTDAFWQGGPKDKFAAHYSGHLNVDKAGRYTFHLTSDDGSALFINGEQVIGNDLIHAMKTESVTLDLSAGAHDIDVLYFEAEGNQTLALEWQGPDTNGAREIISGEAFAYDTSASSHEDSNKSDQNGADNKNIEDHKSSQPSSSENITTSSVEETFNHTDSSGLFARYFALDQMPSRLSDIDFSAIPDATETVSELNNMRMTGAFWQGGPKDKFAAHYSGNLNVNKGGSYEFHLTSDDGSALFINGEQVIGNDLIHAMETESVTVDLSSGVYDIDILYFEAEGNQTLALEWQGPDTNGAREVVSGSALSFENTDKSHQSSKHSENDHEVSATASSILKIYLADAEKNEIITEISSGQKIDSNLLQGRKITIVAIPEPDAQGIGSVQFSVGNRIQTENVIPYALFGDKRGDYKGGISFDKGTHSVAIKVFDQKRANGNLVEDINFDFEVSASNGQTPNQQPFQPPHMDDHTDHKSDDDHQQQKPAPQPKPTPADQKTTSSENGSHSHNHGSGKKAKNDVKVKEETKNETSSNNEHNNNGHNHSDPAVEPPSNPLDKKLADAFVAMIKAMDDEHGHHVHAHDSSMASEHSELLELVDRSDASHVAIQSGDWFDPNTWHKGNIPNANAKVLIPEGITVEYDGESSAKLFTVRVDGELEFATDIDTKMVVDTFVVAPSGRLEIGTEDNPIDADVSATILIARNGNIDTNWDSQLLSRGVLSHGEVEIHGSEKNAFSKVIDDPMAGDTKLALAEIPIGWQVGDTIVLTGTHKKGWSFNQYNDLGHKGTQDEEVTITAINGNVITIDQPLRYDHDTPRDDLKAYVANMSRNVTIASQGGDDVPVHQRGHVMFMHNDDVDVRYAAFDDLGRTDKSESAVDVTSLNSVSSDSNVKGRYSFHFHKTGTEDQENPAIAIGNTVSGSPGWGFVHHSSHANFEDNVAFDVFGAAFAAEDGDETGHWLRNLAIDSQGTSNKPHSEKNMSRVGDHDNGFSGTGFFFFGRAVESVENVAANTTHGFQYFHRGEHDNPLAENLEQPEIAYGNETFSHDKTPINTFLNNEAFGTQYGLTVIKNTPEQNHDVRTIIDNFVAWETANGMHFDYTGHYTILGGEIISTEAQYPTAHWDPGKGINFGNRVIDMAMNGIKIEGFERGIDMEGNFLKDSHIKDFGYDLIGVRFKDNEQDLYGFDPRYHNKIEQSDLREGRLDFDMRGNTSIDWRESISLSGIKTDSIGSRERDFFHDEQEITHTNGNIISYLRENGYYETQDGKNIAIFEDFIADRATGELKKFAHFIELEMSEQSLANENIPFNGKINLGGPAPDARDDFARTAEGKPIYLDLLDNDRDPDGGKLVINGFEHPDHGAIHQQSDSVVKYVPDNEFVGQDRFSYWAQDEEGNFTKAEVVIDVTKPKNEVSVQLAELAELDIIQGNHNSSSNVHNHHTTFEDLDGNNAPTHHDHDDMNIL